MIRNSPRSNSSPNIIIAHTRNGSVTTLPLPKNLNIKAKTNLKTTTNSTPFNNFNSNYSLNSTASSYSNYDSNNGGEVRIKTRSELNVSPTFNYTKSTISSSSPKQPLSSLNQPLSTNVTTRPPFSTTSSSPRNLSPTRQLYTPSSSPPKTSAFTSSNHRILSSPFNSTTNILRSPPVSTTTAPALITTPRVLQSQLQGNGIVPNKHGRSQSVTSNTSSTTGSSLGFYPTSNASTPVAYNNNNHLSYNEPPIANGNGNGIRMLRATSSQSFVNTNTPTTTSNSTSNQNTPTMNDYVQPNVIRTNSSVSFGIVRGNTNSSISGVGAGGVKGLGIDVRLERDRIVNASSGSPEMETGKDRLQLEEKEKEAKIQRKIADLEITNSSLLTINSTLERQKLKHTLEIRDLKRRLRESRLHPPLLPSLSSTTSPTLDVYSEEEEEEDEEEEEELTWEELLEQDEGFSNLSLLLGNLLRKGKEAVVFEPVLEAGRVLNVVEMEEDEFGEEDDEEEEEVGGD